MLLTKDKIFNRIKDSGYLNWSLYWVRSTFDKPHVHTYKNDIEKAGISTPEATEKSIRFLDTIVSEFPEGTRFAVELRQHEKSSGTGVIGLLEFTNGSAQTMNGLGNVPGAPVDYNALGLVPQSIMNENIRLLNEQHNIELEKRFAALDLQRKEDRLKDLESRYKRKISELKKLENKFKDDQSKIAGAIGLLGKQVLQNFIPGLTNLEGTPQEPDNLGAQQNESEVLQAVDEKHNILEEFSTMMYNNKLTAKETKQLLNEFSLFAQNKLKNKTNELHQETTDTE